MNGKNSISRSVAEHYNGIKEIGLQKRTETRIYYLRNFNNWIKSCLISHTVKSFQPKQDNKERFESSTKDCLKRKSEPELGEQAEPAKKGAWASQSSSDHSNGSQNLTVLDLCCGKGGDLLKWSSCDISVRLLVGVDIAAVSIDQCRERWGRNRKSQNLEAKFFTLDCTKELCSSLENFPTDENFDISSCQFSIHYGFESETQAKTIMRNACEKVRVGGYFIGTTLNNRELIRRLKIAQRKDPNACSFGNEVYQISFDDSKSFPAYGCKYHFQLDGVVNCPEFLCDIDLLSKLAAEFGFQLEETFSFREAFENFKNAPRCKILLSIINALEPYTPRSWNLSSKNPNDYDHAQTYFDECLRKKKESRSHERFSIGTISKSEWEAISVYNCFIFKRVSQQAIQFDFEYDEAKIVKEIEAELDDVSQLQPPLVDDYYPRKLNYAHRK